MPAQILSLTSTGTLDATFGDGGLVRVPEIAALGNVVVDGDGWVVTGAGANVVAVRLLQDGTRDKSWRTNGLVTLRVREKWIEHNPTSSRVGDSIGIVVASYEPQEAVLRSTLLKLDRRGAQRSSIALEQRGVLQLRVVGFVFALGQYFAVVNTPAGRLVALTE